MTEIIDGKNAVLGRMATFAARELLAGSEVIIVNADKIIITGSPKKIVGRYLERRRRGTPQHGPFFPKKPDMIVRRTIRSMLPKTKKGRNIFKKLRVYVDVPEDLQKNTMIKLAVKETKTDFIRIGELSKSLGWRG